MGMDRVTRSVAKRNVSMALAVAFSIGIGATCRFGADAADKYPCPSGQIFRVSKKICVAKDARQKDMAARSESEGPPGPETIEGRAEPSSSEQQSQIRGPAPMQEAPAHRDARSRDDEAPGFDPRSTLASVSQLRHARESRTPELEELVGFCRVSMPAFGRDATPVTWATVRNNLANGLAALDERTNETAGLEEAVSLYREALQEKTRERAPRDWATIQTNLGEALTTLGLRENEVAKLAEAAAAKREALLWAKRTADDGIALMRLAERTSDKDVATRALAQIDMALTTIRGGDHGSVLVSYLEEQLPQARALVEKLSEL
jgi:hypothetical protein